ncbi:hypothetical protein [Parendozoicomonas sp. Alg238-R29]|uniref:hypothetical protein n=1 Tax=Parendozoicomonas sp. Alg238-R29 TaxID=2993446 RepID=UPI00248E364D|nr:hypothetical protein [Parendozoicomonas sp. Alg238-R29]
MMKKVLAFVLASVLLGGCSQFQDFPDAAPVVTVAEVKSKLLDISRYASVAWQPVMVSVGDAGLANAPNNILPVLQ